MEVSEAYFQVSKSQKQSFFNRFTHLLFTTFLSTYHRVISVDSVEKVFISPTFSMRKHIFDNMNKSILFSDRTRLIS